MCVSILTGMSVVHAFTAVHFDERKWTENPIVKKPTAPRTFAIMSLLQSRLSAQPLPIPRLS